VDLEAMVRSEVEKLQVVKDITLVDAAGKVLPGPDGKPIVKHLDDCAKLGNEIARGGCEKPFFDAKDCHGKPDEQTCNNRAIACWVTASLNASDDGESPIIVATEVPLVDGNGNPVTDKKTGSQRVRKLADCADAVDKDTCRELFINASNCAICPPTGGDIAACQRNATMTWYDSNASTLD
jgi:hypothetical protein